MTFAQWTIASIFIVGITIGWYVREFVQRWIDNGEEN